MGNSATVGPLKAAISEMDDGTLCRAPSPLPGPLGGAFVQQEENVAGWDLEKKLVESAKRAGPKLPAEMRDQFMSLFTPTSIGITGAVLVAWAASHAFGVGEVADLILGVIGFAMMGWSAIDAGRSLLNFFRVATSAQRPADLERAADHLARFVGMVGITVFIALLAKGAKRFKTASKTAAAESSTASTLASESAQSLERPHGRPTTVTEGGLAVGAEVLIEGVTPEAIAEKQRMVDEFIKDMPGHDYPGMEGRRLSKVGGFDLARPVARRPLPVGTRFVIYSEMGGKPGLWATYPGENPAALGLSGESLAGRRPILFEVKSEVTVIEGFAADINHPDISALRGKGGSLQLLLPPDWQRYVQNITPFGFRVK